MSLSSPEALSSLRFSEIDSRSSAFAQTLEIYRGSFRADERLSDDRLRSLLNTRQLRCFVLEHESEVFAFALLFIPSNEHFVHLDYMVVKKEHRGRQLGSRLFQEIVRWSHENVTTSLFLTLEVGDDIVVPEEWGEDRYRRIRFYERLGARLLENVDYLFPGYSGVPIPMSLMVLSIQGESALSRETLSSVIRTLYIELHNRPEYDSVLTELLHALPERIIAAQGDSK